MVYNITANTYDPVKVAKVSSKILFDLTQELQNFSPSFFPGADLDNPDYSFPVTDVSDQITGSAQKGDVIRVSVPGKLTAKDKIANSSVTNQSHSLSTVDLTLNQHKYVAVTTEDVAKIFDTPNLHSNYGKMMGKAIGESFERSIAALATGFSTVVGGGAGAVMGFDTFGEVNRRFYQNGIDIRRSGYEAVAYVDPTAAEDILQGRDEYQIAGQRGLDQVNKGSILEKPHGVCVTRSNYLIKTGGAVKGMVLTKDAIMIAFGIKPRLQSDYILSELGELMVADVFYGVAEMRDVAGQLLDFDEVNE